MDACLSHGLKRRALGLFKTSSSTALIQKVAKQCPSAEQVYQLMSAEDQKIQQELSRRGSASVPNTGESRRQTVSASLSNPASKRYLWIKIALIEKKLVAIVEHLADNSSRYYEPEALMSNYLCAQILCSLLVGPTALEFSRSKTSDHYQFDDPTAEELMRRHKLANPIACLCQQARGRTMSSVADDRRAQTESHSQLSRSATDSSAALIKFERMPFSASLSVTNAFASSGHPSYLTEPASPRMTNGTASGARPSQRRRPLALKTTVKRGTLVTDCHHYSCQEFGEHLQTRGYSFLNAGASCQPFTTQPANGHSQARESSKSNPVCQNGCQANLAGSVAEWPPWSPRVLHETLHQNARSKLLYAKNNVLLETQPDCSMAGYLSLHQTQTDLILKWIPNQMINGIRAATCCSTSDSSCRIGESARCELSATEPESHQEPAVEKRTSDQPAAVGSAYLDLIVSLTVSRIVLLHCRFGPPEFNQLERNQESEDVRTYHSKQGDTLILVEADGVQRAPFRFPKGGLRLFLSCLESGLHPNKYLDPAIQFGGHDGPPSPEPLLAQQSGFESEPLSGKLNSIWKRLPSLKRKSPSQRRTDGHSSQGESPSSSPSPVPTPEEKSDANEIAKEAQTTSTYIYRIVSVQQPEWPLQTPPHSALSVDSSSSGSFILNMNLAKSPTQASNSHQKFRWSLSKFARFSTSGSLSSTNTSTRAITTSSNTTQSQTTGSTDLSSICEPFNSLDPAGAYQDSQQPKKSTDESSSSTINASVASSRDLARIEAKLEDLKESASDHILALRTQSIQTLCATMRKQILARAFYGWLVHCRKTKLIRAHLTKLLHPVTNCPDQSEDESVFDQPNMSKLVDKLDYESGLTRNNWSAIMSMRAELNELELSKLVCSLVYRGNIEDDQLRKEVWPYLLGHYSYKDETRQRERKDKAVLKMYEQCGADWIKIERLVKQRDRELLAANMAKALNERSPGYQPSSQHTAEIDNSKRDIGRTSSESTTVESEPAVGGAPADNLAGHSTQEGNHDENDDTFDTEKEPEAPEQMDTKTRTGGSSATGASARRRRKRRPRLESTGSVGSDASITDQFGNNVHRIDKDVQRCDRNFWYFKDVVNLDKLRNVMCTYVWQHLDVGYVQGMCDLAAPFLVMFDSEVMAFSCFSRLMERLVSNFPHGCAMDEHFDSLKYLMQVLDPKLYEVLQSNGDYTHFYFCYRWLLLDFKRGEIFA